MPAPSTASAALLAEFDQEMASTRKLLACVPEGKFAWTPHEKSATLGKLANHMALLPAFAALAITRRGMQRTEAASKAELLDLFDRHVATGRQAIAEVSDDQLAEVRATPVEMTLLTILRTRIMSHLIHHRGQLTVYLRLLDIAVPGMYGPSADENSQIG